MIRSNETDKAFGPLIAGYVRAIIKGMGIGTDHARDVGSTNVHLRITRVDTMTFNIAADTGSFFVVGLESATWTIGNQLLFRAWTLGGAAVSNLIANLKAASKTLSADDADAIMNAKIALPSIDDKATKTLDQSDKEYLLRKLRRIQKSAVEGTISRRAIESTIDNLEDDIENRYAPEMDDVFKGAIQILESIFGIKG